MGWLAVALVVAGFAPRLLDTSRRVGPVTPLVAAHAVLCTAWLLVYVLQAHLVRAERRDGHRALGFVALPLAGALIVLGYATAMTTARRGFDLSGAFPSPYRLSELVFPLGDLVSFGVLVAAALWFRARADAHKRLMLLATVGSLMAAPLAHLLGALPPLPGAPPVIVPLLALLYFSPALHDRLRAGRVHPVSLWGGSALLVWANVRAAVIGPSDVWQRFAAWLVH